MGFIIAGSNSGSSQFGNALSVRNRELCCGAVLQTPSLVKKG